MEPDNPIWRKTGHFYFALTDEQIEITCDENFKSFVSFESCGRRKGLSRPGTMRRARELWAAAEDLPEFRDPIPGFRSKRGRVGDEDSPGMPNDLNISGGWRVKWQFKGWI
jgi:hypothetical protein